MNMNMNLLTCTKTKTSIIEVGQGKLHKCLCVCVCVNVNLCDALTPFGYLPLQVMNPSIHTTFVWSCCKLYCYTINAQKKCFYEPLILHVHGDGRVPFTSFNLFCWKSHVRSWGKHNGR